MIWFLIKNIFTIIDVIVWNKKTFSLSTKISQCKKFREEINELNQTKFKSKKYFKELADCYIVSFGMFRFDFKLAISFLKYLDYYNCDSEIISKTIKEKMKINKKREWKYVNGTYHH